MNGITFPLNQQPRNRGPDGLSDHAVAGDWSGAETVCENSSGCQSDCPEDIDGDGYINVSDLLSVVGDWGSTDSNADVDNNGVVDTSDLLAVIGAWGPCN